MKRIFIAIKSSAEIQSWASAWNKDKQEWPVRWIPEENLHITLVPPWNEDDISETVNKLKQIQGKVDPFDMEFKKIVYGPRPNNFRLIWAEGEESKNLVKLKEEIEKIFDIKSLKRGFKLHLTLARFKPKDFSSLPLKKLNEQINLQERVESVEIIESILKPEGAIYRALKSIKL